MTETGNRARKVSGTQGRKNFENRKKNQRRRIAWVGQTDFGKLELNNRNHGGKCQHLSAKRDQFDDDDDDDTFIKVSRL